MQKKLISIQESDKLANLIVESKHRSALVDKLLSIFDNMLNMPNTFIVNWHPLGFLQFKIGKTSSGGSIKLHLWHEQFKSQQNPNWLIHKHVWELTSQILIGSVKNTTYKILSKDGHQDLIKSDEHFKYKVEFSGQKSIMKKLDGNFSLILDKDDIYHKGDIYTVSINEFHKTTLPDNEFTATIIYTPKKIRKNPTVIGDKQITNSIIFNREICEYKIWKLYLNQLKNILINEK